MLKILRTVPFFAPAYGYGGPVVHTLNVSKIQASLGYDVRIFTSNILTNDIISKNLPKFEIINGIKIHRFPISIRLGRSHYFITPQLQSAFLKYNYDIIHSHSYRTFQTDVATLNAKFKRKPFVFTAHGTLRKMYQLNLFLGKKKETNRMKLHDLFFKNFFINTVDKVIVHSKHEKSWTLNFNIPEEKIRIIPHGINLEEFTNTSFRDRFIKKYNITSNDKMILYVGRLLRNYRNLEDLIILMNDIISEIKNVRLWLIGHSYDKAYEYLLKKMVEKRNLKKHVIFLTQPSREDIIGAYQIANLVVFPLTNSDGFGIPLIEAGAAKTPIISTNRPPATEIVKNGETGILTKINDLDDLKESILKILSDKELEKRMGLYGYNHVRKNYTWEIITEQINKVYEEII